MTMHHPTGSSGMQWATRCWLKPNPPQEEPPGRAGCWEPWLSIWPVPTVRGRQEERSIALGRDAVWLFGPCCGWGGSERLWLAHGCSPPSLPAGRRKAQRCRGTGGADGCRHREVRGVLASPGCTKKGRGAAGLRSSVLP